MPVDALGALRWLVAGAWLLVKDGVCGWVAEEFGIRLTSVDEVGYGADDAAELWRGRADDGMAYAVKLSGGGDPAGLIVSAHLAAHGVAGVPAPARTLDGRLWIERDGRRLSVVPWVSDERAISTGLSPEQWIAFGVLLAQVHATPSPDGLPREDHTHERVTRALDNLSVEPVDELSDELSTRWQADVVDELVQQADRLGQHIRARSVPKTVVCHGDPHLGNVLTGDRVWLIDWDDAVLAPRERDLMFIDIGVLLPDLPVTAEQQAWFFDGYGAVDLDLTRLAYYRCARALEDLVYPAAQILNPTRYPEPEREFALSIIDAVLSPTGLATLALESARGTGALRRP